MKCESNTKIHIPSRGFNVLQQLSVRVLKDFWGGIYNVGTQIARFMGQTWGPLGTCQPKVGPMSTPWTLLSGCVFPHGEAIWVQSVTTQCDRLGPNRCFAWYTKVIITTKRPIPRIVSTTQDEKMGMNPFKYENRQIRLAYPFDWDAGLTSHSSALCLLDPNLTGLTKQNRLALLF